MNKRGQTEVGLGTLLLVIVGVVGLILVGMFVYNSWIKIGKLTDLTPEDRTLYKQVCAGNVENGNLFCEDFKKVKIEKDIQYFNCKQMNGVLGLGIDSSAVKCVNSEENYCKYLDTTLEDKEYEKAFVNGKKCIEWVGGVGTAQILDASLASDGILAFKGDGNFEVLSYEECVSGLEQRKKDLEIPDKLCYWEAMTEVYDEKCDNLDEEDIAEIFQKKAEYRQLNNPDWPSLNTDGDFCVDVVYDCDGWEKIPKLPFMNDYFTKGGAGPMGLHFQGISIYPQRIFINPFLVISSKDSVVFILHEGLHSVQDKKFDSKKSLYSFDSYSNDFITAYPEYLTEYNSIKESQNILSDLTSLIDNEKKVLKQELFLKPREECNTKYKEGSEEYWRCVTPLLDLNDNLTRDYEEFVFIFKNQRVLKVNDFQISSQNKFYNFYSTNKEFNSKFSLLKQKIPSNIVKIMSIISSITYVSTIVELDPRLSEVHRWWFDQTAPDCEVLYTSEQFEEALGKFLSDSNTAEEYQITKRQLNDVLEVAEKMEKRDEIWNKLIGRGPGLASNTDYNNRDMVA